MGMEAGSVNEVDEVYKPAPEGCVYVCAACGKTSKTRAGDLAQVSGYVRVSDPGWDESCMIHAVLCKSERDQEGRWVAV